MPINPRIAQACPRLRAPGGVLVVGSATTSDLTGNAAFQSGDVIRGINTIAVKSIDELRSATRGLVSGESVVIRVERAGKMLYLPFELE